MTSCGCAGSSRLDQAPPVNQDGTNQPPSIRSRGRASSEDEPLSDILRKVVDYPNGMTQEEVARKHGLHIQTIRKRLKAAGVVTRSSSTALTAQDLDETRHLLNAGPSAREIARWLSVRPHDDPSNDPARRCDNGGRESPSRTTKRVIPTYRAL